MKLILLTILIIFPLTSIAGEALVKPKRISITDHTKNDAYDTEFRDKSRLIIDYKDMGIKLSVNTFNRSYYMDNKPSKIINEKFTGFFFKIDKKHRSFNAGNDIRLNIEFQEAGAKYGEYIRYVSCMKTYVINGGPKEKCFTYSASNKFRLVRGKNGELKTFYKQNGFSRWHSYRSDPRYEYFELYMPSDLFTHYAIEDGLAKPKCPVKPVFILSSVNKKSGASSSIIKMKSGRLAKQSAPWDIYKADAEAYLSQIPTIKPAIQVGVAINTAHANLSVAVATDFNDIAMSVAPGVSSSYDTEYEAFANVFAVNELTEVTKGDSVTVSADYAGFGGSLIYDPNGNIQGGGVTVGYGLPSVETTASTSYELLTSKPSSNNNNDRNNDRDHNPNYGGRGDNHHGNDRNSGYAGGTSENSDGGRGVNTPWGGR